MSTEPRPVGRPPHYDDPAEFERLADEYFSLFMEGEGTPTVNGLALHLGFNSRQSLLNYEGKPEFVDVVKKARTRLELAWEQKLAGPNAGGTIFWLKNQGWSDKTEQEISGPGGKDLLSGITVTFVRPE